MLSLKLSAELPTPNPPNPKSQAPVMEAKEAQDRKDQELRQAAKGHGTWQVGEATSRIITLAAEVHASFGSSCHVYMSVFHFCS